MHQLKLPTSCNAPYRVVKAYFSCVAGCSGMCTHIVSLLKQLIHYVMKKLQPVPADLTCSQMQQSWNKPRPTEIQAAPVMNVFFSKAIQSEAKKRASYLQCVRRLCQVCTRVQLQTTTVPERRLA